MQEETSSPEPTSPVAQPASVAPPAAADPKAESHWERDALERLLMAQLAEQRAARRWRIGFRLFWTGLFLAGLWLDRKSTRLNSSH